MLKLSAVNSGCHMRLLKQYTGPFLDEDQSTYRLTILTAMVKRSTWISVIIQDGGIIIAPGMKTLAFYAKMVS